MHNYVCLYVCNASGMQLCLIVCIDLSSSAKLATLWICSLLFQFSAIWCHIVLWSVKLTYGLCRLKVCIVCSVPPCQLFCQSYNYCTSFDLKGTHQLATLCWLCWTFATASGLLSKITLHTSEVETSVLGILQLGICRYMSS